MTVRGSGLPCSLKAARSVAGGAITLKAGLLSRFPSIGRSGLTVIFTTILRELVS